MGKSQSQDADNNKSSAGGNVPSEDSMSMMSLENQFLIAMPTLGDPYFNKTVTYICEHNDEGAMGLIINLPVNLTLLDLLKQVDMEEGGSVLKDGSSEKTASADPIVIELTDINNSLEQPVLAGGPIAKQRGFVLHNSQAGWSSSLALSNEIMVTTSKDILSALGNENGPDKALITLGYAGWTAGQLEEEIQHNSLLTIEADLELLFDVPIHKKWEAAVQKLGVDVWQLGPDIGHA